MLYFSFFFLEVKLFHVIQSQTGQPAVWVCHIAAAAVDADKSVSMVNLIRLFEFARQIASGRMTYDMHPIEVTVRTDAAPDLVEVLVGWISMNQMESSIPNSNCAGVREFPTERKNLVPFC